MQSAGPLSGWHRTGTNQKLSLSVYFNAIYVTIKWSEKVTIEEVLERIGEKRTLLNNILHRIINRIGHILRHFLLHDAIEGQMTEVKGVGRRRTKLFDDLGNRI